MIQWDFLSRAIHSGSLAHAYLFYGNDRESQFNTAMRLAQVLICESGEPCFVCHSCKLIAARTHPDTLFIAPNAESGSHAKQIKIGEIRTIQAFLQHAPYQAPIKAVIMSEAHLMNSLAQSALLKMLEEPRGTVIFLLLAEYPALILPTIRSRTQSLPFYQFHFRNTEESAAHGTEAQTLDQLGNAFLAERFAYAKTLAETQEQVSLLLEQWLVAARDHLVSSLFRTNDMQEVMRWKRIAQTLQDMLFYTQRTNINTRLAVEQVMLAL